MSASDPTETQDTPTTTPSPTIAGRASWSVRTIRHDGTLAYYFPEDEKKARDLYSGIIRGATSQIKRVELRRHDHAGITVLAEKEGAWRTH